MAIRLKRIRIQNFKLFENFPIEFSSLNLVVFDGPNGFGKTSFYDAIELLFTGRLRRYTDLVGKTVDKRQSANGSPLLNDHNGSGDLVIKGELDVDGTSVCLMRRGNRDELEATTSLDELKLKFYRATQFDSEDFSLIEDENSYLTDLLGQDYIRNFEFLNYIEQEENIYLLKKKDKDRKVEIAHLFNTSDFEERIGKLTEASKKIGKLCDAKAKASLDVHQKKLDGYRCKLTGEHVSVPFKRFISWKEIDWDGEKLEFPDERYVEWLGKEGELAKLELFLTNIDEFRKDRENKKLDRLLADGTLITQFLLCWNFIDSAEDFSKRLALKKAIDDLLQAYEQGALQAVEQGKAELPLQIQELIRSEIDVQAYSASITGIIKMQKSANTLSQLIVGVKNSRQAFIEKFMQYDAATGAEKSCPLCGYSWQDAKELKANFDTQEDKLEELITESGTELNEAVEDFTKIYLKPVREFLTDHLSKHPIDEAFVNKLKEAAHNRANLELLNQQFVALDIDLKAFLNYNPSINEQLKVDELRAKINEKKHALNPENLRPYFASVFLQIFNERFDHAAKIEKTEIENKRKYIERQYFLHQSKVIKELSLEYNKQEKLFNDAEILKSKIARLKKIYETSLNEYQKSLIENIEIFFHIYSGRITQEVHGGLGLFIESEKNGIRFLENHSKKHDAVFTMSSGQLAALVIAFTLALNKRYSRNKLLFIDDPIQTLDELNIAGLVELLRNEFADRQIFISTHEDMMSAYMRYKFQKFGLQAERVSFKERQLSLS